MPEAAPAAERLAPLVLLVVPLVPLVSLALGEGAWLSVPGSELPVKIWMYHTFPPGPHLLGGPATGIAFPLQGVLDNPDPVGSLVTNLLAPLVGWPRAWAALLALQLLANAAAMFVLARGLCGSARAAVVAGVAFGLAPFVLTYGVSSAIADLLNLWPYPLLLHFGLRALRTGARDGALAGVFLGLGFGACPYDVLVMAPLVFPVLGGLLLARERPALGVALRAALGFAVAAVAVAGPFAFVRAGILGDPSSLMSADLVQATRHEAPYPSLAPHAGEDYVAPLLDYLRTGPGALDVRKNAARFLRAFGPGLVVLGLGAWGTFRARRRREALWPWWLVVLFFALASSGPYLTLARDRGLGSPLNVVWLFLHEVVPGGAMLLEPFRYALAVALGASVLAGFGALALVRRWGTAGAVAAVAAILLELVTLSPVPMPLPTTDLAPPPWARQVDALLPPGGILELPYTERGTRVFNRDHFTRQLAHGRPIVDVVHGTWPPFLTALEPTRALLEREREPKAAQVARPLQEAVVQRLRLAGLAGVVVRPALYASPEHAAAALAALETLGEPVEVEGELIYALRP